MTAKFPFDMMTQKYKRYWKDRLKKAQIRYAFAVAKDDYEKMAKYSREISICAQTLGEYDN